jgi:hypothetical protein
MGFLIVDVRGLVSSVGLGYNPALIKVSVWHRRTNRRWPILIRDKNDYYWKKE